MKTYLLSLFLFPFSLFPFTCPASNLSLTSTNQYVYCHVLTNGIFDVRGLGVGREASYSMPRYEDWYFFSEAVSEREHVSYALTRDAAKITTNEVGSFGMTIPYYTALPNYIHQSEDLYLKFLSLVGATNLTYLSRPENYITRPVVLDGAASLNDSYIKMIFQNMRCPISTHVYDTMRRATNSWFMATPRMPTFGIVTNWYADIIENSHPIFKQKGRLCNGPYSRRTRTIYSKPSFIGSFHWNGDNVVWDSIPLTDTDITTQNSGTYNDGSYILITSERRTATKKSVVARSKGVVVARNNDSYSSWYYSERDLKPRISLPKFEQGTILNGIYKGFVVIDFERTVSSGTNVFLKVNKTVIGPANFTYEGATQEGYPVFRHENGKLADLHDACCTLLNQEVMSEGALLNLIDEPADGATETGTDQIITTVKGYIGHADITFHARVLQ